MAQETTKPKDSSQAQRPSLAAFKDSTEREHASLDKMLISAVIAGNEADVRKALDAGAAVDFLDPDLDCTPLTFAAEKGHTKICALLIERGADVNAIHNGQSSINATPWWCQTPLMRAAFREHIETCALLIEKGAGPQGIEPSELSDRYHCYKSAAFFTSMKFLRKLLGKERQKLFISHFRPCVWGGA